MAKGQTSFAEKARKASEHKADAKQVLVIQSVKNPKKDTVKFSNRMVAVPADTDMDNYLKEILETREIIHNR